MRIDLACCTTVSMSAIVSASISGMRVQKDDTAADTDYDHMHARIPMHISFHLPIQMSTHVHAHLYTPNVPRCHCRQYTWQARAERCACAGLPRSSASPATGRVACKPFDVHDVPLSPSSGQHAIWRATSVCRGAQRNAPADHDALVPLLWQRWPEHQDLAGGL